MSKKHTTAGVHPSPPVANPVQQKKTMTMKVGETQAIAGGSLASATSDKPAIVSISEQTVIGLETIVSATAHAVGTATLTVHSPDPVTREFIDVTVNVTVTA